MFANLLSKHPSVKSKGHLPADHTLIGAADNLADLRARLVEMEARAREINLLNEMGELLLACRTLDEAYTVITQLAGRLFPGVSGALCVISASRNLVEAVVTWGEAQVSPVFAPDECWALRRGRTHAVTGGQAGMICQHVSAPSPVNSLCIPLTAQGETLGLLHLQSCSSEQPDCLTEAQQQLAVAVARQIALALANLTLRETLRNQAICDPLTGLYNRRYMEESLEREIRRAARRDNSLGVVMLDLDHFKQFNDTYGHAAGDSLLRDLGAFIQTHTRGEDIACRYGGEEFILIFLETSSDVTRQRVEQLREGIKSLVVLYYGRPLAPVTCSVGVAVFPEHGQTGEALLRAADAALYRAKQAGRDRVIVSG